MSSKYLCNSTKIVPLKSMSYISAMLWKIIFLDAMSSSFLILLKLKRLIDGNLHLMGFPGLFLFKASLADWNRWSFPNSVPQLQARKQILCLVLRLRCFVFVFLWDSVQLSQQFNLYFETRFLLYSLLISNVLRYFCCTLIF